MRYAAEPASSPRMRRGESAIARFRPVTRVGSGPRGASFPTDEVRHGIARAMSKRGYCSRSRAAELVRAGRVQLNGRTVRDPEAPTRPGDRISVDGGTIAAAEAIWIMLNKPRGIVTTARDEHGRDTVYALVADPQLPWLAPVGRLDKASEGLLLLTNDSAAAARLTAPESHVDKTYHVQIDRVPAADLLAALRAGVDDAGERLSAKSVQLLRSGARHAWLEIVLDEGRNRHIRRLLAAHGIDVLRLVRVAIGQLALGELAKGSWRRLDAGEVAQLR